MVEVLDLGAGLLAQASAGRATPGGVLSVWELAVKGGWVMIPIGLGSLVALAIVVERWVSLQRQRIAPTGLAEQVRLALRNGGKAALDACAASATPLGRLLAVAVRNRKLPREQREKQLEQAATHEVFALRQPLRILTLIVAVSPMLGLLGTVFGMIKAFQTVAASAEALGRTELLAKGIYEALVTTAAGLLVAIPALAAHHWLSARIDRRVIELDAALSGFLDDAAGEAAATAPMTVDASRVLPVAGAGEAAVVVSTSG